MNNTVSMRNHYIFFLLVSLFTLSKADAPLVPSDSWLNLFKQRDVICLRLSLLKVNSIKIKIFKTTLWGLQLIREDRVAVRFLLCRQTAWAVRCVASFKQASCVQVF